MTRTAIIIHGTPSQEEFSDPCSPSESNKHWIPWLQNQLLIHGYHTQTPEMPQPYQPRYNLWKEEFERFSVSKDSLLLGHSCGGGFLLRWLSENPVEVARVVLVAPWLDPEGRKCTDFFDSTISTSIIDRTDLHLVVSDNDMAEIDNSVDRIRAVFPGVNEHLFPGYGHFCLSDMGTAEFPELFEICLGNQRQ